MNYMYNANPIELYIACFILNCSNYEWYLIYNRKYTHRGNWQRDKNTDWKTRYLIFQLGRISLILLDESIYKWKRLLTKNDINIIWSLYAKQYTYNPQIKYKYNFLQKFQPVGRIVSNDFDNRRDTTRIYRADIMGNSNYYYVYRYNDIDVYIRFNGDRVAYIGTTNHNFIDFLIHNKKYFKALKQP